MGSEKTCRQMGHISSSSKQFLHVSAMSDAIAEVCAGIHWVLSPPSEPRLGARDSLLCRLYECDIEN